LANKRRAAFLNQHKAEQGSASKTVNNCYPKFSFEFCFGSKRGIEQCSKDEKSSIFDKIIFLSRLSWQEIKDLPREQGFEKLKISELKSLANMPTKFENEKKVDVFRLPSDKGRLIGYIEGDTFFVVWIDTKFTMYKHKG
jgi:hypothetical protein